MSFREVAILSLLTLAGCQTLRISPLEEKTKTRPVIDYFYSPTAQPIDKSAASYKYLREAFGDVTIVIARCTSSEKFAVHDEAFCAQDYGQDAKRNASYLHSFNGNTLPSVFVNGVQVKSDEEVCQALGYIPDCVRMNKLKLFSLF